MAEFKIDQKISIGNQFEVLNEDNQPVYRIKSQLISLVPKFTVYTPDGTAVAEISKKLVSFVPEYVITIGGKKEATIRKKFISFTPKLEVEGPGWAIEGDFVAWKWKIVKGFETIAVARKKLLTITDKYVLTVNNDANDLLCICCAIVVDQMEEDNKNDQKK